MDTPETTVLPQIYATFTIRGLGLDLSGITTTLGFEASSTQKAGSRWSSPPRPQMDVWALNGTKQTTVEGGATIEKMVDVLDEVKEKLKQVRSVYPEAIFDLTLVVYVTSPSCVFPDITMPSGLLARIAGLGLRFTVSTYAVADD